MGLLILVVVKQSADLLTVTHSRKSENHSTALALSNEIGGGVFHWPGSLLIVPEGRLRNECEIHCH